MITGLVPSECENTGATYKKRRLEGVITACIQLVQSELPVECLEFCGLDKPKAFDCISAKPL